MTEADGTRVGAGPQDVQLHVTIAAHGVPGNVVLERCGHRRQRTACTRWCFTPALVHGHVVWADDRGRIWVRGVRTLRAVPFAAGRHNVAGVYPAGSRVVLATDTVAGTPRFTVRSASARALGIG